MALITPEELIVYLDLPADTQPTDRAQLVCTLVVDAVTKAAGAALTVPYPAGVVSIAFVAAARLYDNPLALRSQTVGSVSSTYAGDVTGILTPAEKDDIAGAAGSGGPKYSFPTWDWSWRSAGASTVTSE